MKCRRQYFILYVSSFISIISLSTSLYDSFSFHHVEKEKKKRIILAVHVLLPTSGDCFGLPSSSQTVAIAPLKYKTTLFFIA